ncbi:pimeloyl-ACP methyl ester carboxylesterase [Melaminivora alkalimesophila]|uniref:Pimeloyl-ACP methyl ester carboxylesterase n=2 Tax=Melaminivora alkalimesophila TaxID=1165852 RepID=A0A317RCU3_9BURK|nr:lipase family protein [Melaminivora alkalimesophila]PWW46991.1 pimeloyl-ACP methyl ester carboxylesterase [Melaminivora alkalimesophila]
MMSIALCRQGTAGARWPLAVAAALALAGCGGGSGDGNDSGGGQGPVDPPVDPPPVQLELLLEARELQHVKRAAIATALQEGQSKLSEVAPPRYSVATYRLVYRTVDKDGAPVRASGLVAVPQKPAGSSSPVISYQHATTFQNANAPSINLQPGEPPLVLASLGYIVVAADYVGFGESQGLPHPYLQSDATARAVLDMIGAAQEWRRLERVPDNGQLYLVGYSEGGYATMAAQREMERSGSPLRAQLQASLPAAGPYDVQATLDGLLGRVREEYPEIAWLLKPGTLKHLGSKVRAEVRRALLRELTPDDADVAYDARFIDHYLADDRDALREQASVHWGWTPGAPVFLFHGRDDQTVPFAASESARDTLVATQGAPVQLQECERTVPAGHLQCVPEYFEHALQVMGRTASDL